MGWYALYKWFRIFRKSPYTDYISWYKQYLYDEWFENLSDEEKTAEIQRQQQLVIEKEREFRTALAMLGIVHTAVYDASVRAGGKHNGIHPPQYLPPEVERINQHFQNKWW